MATGRATGYCAALASRPDEAAACERVQAETARTAADCALHSQPGPAPVHENLSWGYRRIHGELATLGIKVVASTVWEILKAEGIDPAPDRSATTWADFLRSQADALVAVDFMETITLTGQRQYILAAIEHATRRVRVLGTTAHPTAARVIQAAKNLAIDLEDAHATVKYLIPTVTRSTPPISTECSPTPWSRSCSAGSVCRE